MYASYACARLEALSLLIPLQRSLGVTQCEVRGPEIEIPGVVHGEDVRMREPGGELDLTQEPLGADLRGDLRAQRLHRDVAVVLDVVREEDDRHSPLSQLALDLVSAVETVGQAFLECTHAVNITRETLGCEFGVLVSLECRRVRRAGPAARTADPFGWDRAADAHAAGSTPTPSPRRRCPATGTRRQCDLSVSHAVAQRPAVNEDIPLSLARSWWYSSVTGVPVVCTYGMNGLQSVLNARASFLAGRKLTLAA